MRSRRKQPGGDRPTPTPKQPEIAPAESSGPVGEALSDLLQSSAEQQLEGLRPSALSRPDVPLPDQPLPLARFNDLSTSSPGSSAEPNSSLSFGRGTSLRSSRTLGSDGSPSSSVPSFGGSRASFGRAPGAFGKTTASFGPAQRSFGGSEAPTDQPAGERRPLPRPIVDGPIAFVPEVDGPILAAGEAYRQNLALLWDLGFTDEKAARRHLDRLRHEPGLTAAYADAERAWREAVDESRQQHAQSSTLREVLRSLPGVEDRLFAVDVPLPTDRVFDASHTQGLYRLGRRIQRKGSPSILSTVVEETAALEAQLERLAPGGHPGFGSVRVDDDDLAHLLETVEPDRYRFLSRVPVAVRTARMLPLLDWNFAWAHYLAARPKAADLVLDARRSATLGTHKYGLGAIDLEADEALISLGMGASADAAMQARRLHALHGASSDSLERALAKLAADKDKLLEVTGEQDLARALRQVRQSQGWPERPPSRVVSGGLPTLGRRR